MDLEALLRAVRDGKPGAWNALHPSLCRVLHRYFLREFDESSASELTQRTVAILARQLPEFIPRESLSQWVFGIARNQRRMEYEARAQSNRALRELAANIRQTPNTTPSARVYAKEVIAALLEEIEKLPPYYRAIIENDLKGGDTKEFAERQNISVSTARTRRFRAIEILRARLAARLDPPRLPASAADSTSSSSTPPPA